MNGTASQKAGADNLGLLEGLKEVRNYALYAAAIALFVTLNGMVSTFDTRALVTGVLSAGYAILIIAVSLNAYLSARKLHEYIRSPTAPGRSMPRSAAVTAGSFVGAAASLPLVGLVAAAQIMDMRSVFVHVTQELIDLLTFGFGAVTGSLALILLSALTGALGAAVYLLPARSRRFLITSLLWFTVAGLTSEVIRITFSELKLPSSITRVIVTTSGLTIAGGLIALSIPVIIQYVQLTLERRRSSRAEAAGVKSRARRYGSLAAVLILILVLPMALGRVVSDVLVLVGIYILMGFGLNIVVGKAGLLDLGYVAFFAVGAYTTAMLTSADVLPGVQLSFWSALPFTIIVTGLTGLLIGAPVLRMRGDYLAIVTLGFGEIARFLALSDWFKPWLGGAQGIVKIPSVNVLGMDLIGPENLYYIVIVFILIILFFSWRLEGSRVGRALEAMREDEQVAQVMGINTVYYKLLAFALGAMIASLGGAIFAVKLSAIFPHSFDVEVSITVLSLLIIGGLGSLPGVIVGAIFLVGLPELLREFSEYRLLLYGATLVIMMIVRPEGLVPSQRRARELHEDELSQDAWLKLTEAGEAD